MLYWSLLLLILTWLDATCVSAATIPFKVHISRGYPPHLLRRQQQSSIDITNGSIPILNSFNSQYISNITLGGRSIPVLLDTGSSDLWVTGDVPGARDSNKAVELKYAVGMAKGDIFFAPAEFGGYSVQDQAFLLVANTSSFSTNITAQGYNGLLGLGPNSGSRVRDKIDDKSADTLMDRIFTQDEKTRNYITFVLDRQGDPQDLFTGQFTISELVAGFERVLDQPKLEVVKVHKLTDENQHWQVYTDVDGVTGPDGQPIVTKSIVPKASKGRLVAVVDSGFTFTQVPRTMSDAIYGRVQGARWDEKNSVWTIPCTQMLNVSMKFGGVNFPVHPLDTSSSDFNLTSVNGERVCVGTFQPITSAFSLLGEYDIILGMSFLRNAYSLIDFGDFVEESKTDRDDPFIQMLALTDVNQAHTDFVQVRLNGVDTTGDASQALVPPEQGLKSPQSDAEKKAHMLEKVLSRWPYILLGSLALTGLCVGVCIWKCCCHRCRKGGANANRGHRGTQRTSVIQAVLPLSAVKAPGTYRPLEDPAPPAASSQPPPYSTYSGAFRDPYRA